MFIRIKKVNGYEYAYLVRSVWNTDTKKVKQEVVKYLGNLTNPKRIHKLDLSKLSAKELEIIKRYMEGLEVNFDIPPPIDEWKSKCPKCEMKKSPQAKQCRSCSTKKKFHGWCTPDFLEEWNKDKERWTERKVFKQGNSLIVHE
jgi:hypothetical protein